MSGHIDKRRETTPRLMALESLPPELLEMVLDCLDVRSLCTARLVCKAFLNAASCSVGFVMVPIEYLRSHPDINFKKFPCASLVAILGLLEACDLPLLAQPALGHAVTHVRIADNPSSSPLTLPPLPSLRFMEIGPFALDNSFHFPASLEELHLGAHVSNHNGDGVTRLAHLICLDFQAHEHRGMPFEGLTTLTNLQRLLIGASPSIFPCLGGLVLLTSLDWACLPAMDAPVDLAPFTRLRNLVHLGVGPVYLVLAAEHVRTIGQISSLRSLNLDARGSMLLDRTLLAPLSRLTYLKQSWCCLAGRSLQKMNIEGLGELSLRNASKLGYAAEAVPILQRASGLTSLFFSWGKGWEDVLQPGQFSLVLTHMTRLQSLRLEPTPSCGEFCFEAIGLLTGLTLLHWGGYHVTNADVAACANLRKLEVLSIIPEHFAPSGPVSLEVFLAVATLPELKKLELGKHLGIWGNCVTDEIAARFNAERHSRGWPPLVLEFPGTFEPDV